MQYHGQGATGIYAFNWYADRNSTRDLLLTDAEVLIRYG